MKFRHVVNYNGTYYAAGEEVPITEEKVESEPSFPLFKEVAVESATPTKRSRRAKKEV